MGKTALAVHWAHRVTSQFPDGQLYADLRGFAPANRPMPTSTALRRFLEALGVEPERLPSEMDGQVALYRSILAGRKMLIVLDNARDAEHVRPLLPGSATCAAVVTSRDQLTGLIAAEDARPLPLSPLSTAESRQLLTNRLGEERVSARREAIDQIIIRCAGLPLALAVAAARVGAADAGIASVAGRLRDTQPALDVLRTGDSLTDIRGVLSWSYRNLSDGGARLFRLLGLQTAPDIGVCATASLATASLSQTRSWLGELIRAHLLFEPVPDRYTFHDLLREYAAETAAHSETPSERRSAIQRLLDHYLHTGHAAALLMSPTRHPIISRAPAHGVTLEGLGDLAEATAWTTAERAALIEAIHQANEERFDEHVWELAWTLTIYLHRHGLWQDLVDTQQPVLETATRAGDRARQAEAHREIAGAYILGVHDEDAAFHLRQSSELYQSLDDHGGQGKVLQNLAWISDRQGDYAGALRHATDAVALHRLRGNHSGVANSLNAVAWYRVHLRQHQEAIADARQALALQQELGNQSGQADTLDTLGFVCHQSGEYQDAIGYYEQAIAISRRLDNPFAEAGTLDRLGDTLLAAGDVDGARGAWHIAWEIFHEPGHPDAARLRSKLDTIAIGHNL